MTISDRADLDSALNIIEDVIARIADAAQRHATDPEGSVAVDLYEVERSLQAASRRLAVVVRHLDG